MKILVERTKDSQIFKKGQLLEVDFCLSLDPYKELEISLYVESYHVKLKTFFIERSMCDFFNGVPDVIDGWKFIKKVE